VRALCLKAAVLLARSVLERQEILHWPNQDRKVLEEGDVEEGLNAAAQIGDDRMQKHAQRLLGSGRLYRWRHPATRALVRRAKKSGSQSCDTFSEGAV